MRTKTGFFNVDVSTLGYAQEAKEKDFSYASWFSDGIKNLASFQVRSCSWLCTSIFAIVAPQVPRVTAAGGYLDLANYVDVRGACVVACKRYCVRHSVGHVFAR